MYFQELGILLHYKEVSGLKDICDLPSKNQPSSHLVVFREILI